MSIYLLYMYNDYEYNSHIFSNCYYGAQFNLCETAHHLPLFFFIVALSQPRNT